MHLVYDGAKYHGVAAEENARIAPLLAAEHAAWVAKNAEASEYYRNLTADDFRDALDLDALFSDYHFSTNDRSHDLYFWGLVQEETP